MPRTVSIPFRTAAMSQYSDEVDLAFVTISHPLLTEPIQVVNDAKNFVWNGDTYIGYQFKLQLLTDDDNAPKAAQISFQNVSSKIGATIRRLVNSARIKIDLLHSSDFNLAADPRTPTGTPSVIPCGNHLFLVNVSVTVLAVTGDIAGYDYTQRNYPTQRATQDALPGLFI